MSAFKDLFSKQAGEYARFRPRYPAALFDFLASISPARDAAWDCATGNGQAAVELASRFTRVYATDASKEQLSRAEARPNIAYSVAPAESSGLADESVDLITVAQALHWFDFERFWAEAGRVGREGAVLAAWSYGLAEIDPRVDEVVLRLHDGIVGPYWDPERQHVIFDGYRSIPFPFEELEHPPFVMEQEWSLGALLGYLSTWSAVAKYRKAKNEDPLPLVESDLRLVWGDPSRVRRARWQLRLRLGKISR